MASEEKRRMLLALSPLLLHPPPIIQTSHLLHSTTETTDIDLTSGIASAAALTVMDMDHSKKQSPHPQQGGRRITTEYLQELSDSEALWAFQYASLGFVICGQI